MTIGPPATAQTRVASEGSAASAPITHTRRDHGPAISTQTPPRLSVVSTRESRREPKSWSREHPKVKNPSGRITQNVSTAAPSKPPTTAASAPPHTSQDRDGKPSLPAPSLSPTKPFTAVFYSEPWLWNLPGGASKIAPRRRGKGCRWK